MRMGKKHQPTYRLVAADSRSPRNGRFIEVVGFYSPRGRSASDQAAIIEIDNDKASAWLSKGAQPTEPVERLLRQAGIRGGGSESAVLPVEGGRSAGGGITEVENTRVNGGSGESAGAQSAGDSGDEAGVES